MRTQILAKAWVIPLAALMALVGCAGGSGGGKGAANRGSLDPDAYEPNDTLLTAAPIDLDFDSTALTLHEPTDEDYYEFTLAVDASVTAVARFDPKGASTGMQLLDQAGMPLASGGVDLGEATVSSSLTAGTYVLRVQCGSGMAGAYSLSMFAGAPQVLPPDSFEPNDSPGACHGIGDLNAISVFPQFEAQGLTVHQAGDLDYFCFSLSVDSRVFISIDFDPLGGGLSLALYDAALTPVAMGAVGTSGLLATADIPPGNYVIEVAGVGPATNTYDLAVSLGLAPDMFEPNDTPQTCAAVPLPLTLTSLTIHSPSDEDWFCFNLPATQPLWSLNTGIFFQHSVGDLDLELYESAVTLLAESRSTDDNESIQMDLLPGDYFIRVFSPGEMNIYDLTASAQ